MYDKVIITLILIVECIDLIWRILDDHKKARKNMARRGRRILTRMGF